MFDWVGFCRMDLSVRQSYPGLVPIEVSRKAANICRIAGNFPRREKSPPPGGGPFALKLAKV